MEVYTHSKNPQDIEPLNLKAKESVDQTCVSEDIWVKQENENVSSLQSECDENFESELIKSENEEEKSRNILDNESTAYKCNLCSEEFKLFSEYKTHRKEHFIQKRTCKICKIVCQSISKLEIHMNAHLGLKPFKCAICEKNFISKNQLQLHGRCHSTEKKYQCEKCDKAFRNLGSLRSHMIIHNNIKEFHCKDCDETFENIQSYRKHLSTHGRHFEIRCNLCNKEFQTDRHLQMHLNSHDELQFPCEYCGRIYPSLYRLNRHVKRAHIPSVCDDCNAVFYDRAMYTKHKKQHNDDKPSVCTFCGKSFEKAKNLSEHIRLQHKEDGNIHKCDLCEKTFINAPLLRNHIKTHDKSFKCKFCDKLFSSRYNLETHSITHTGERNHICDICGNAYSTRTSLKNHKATHSDVRNFKCDQCPKSFKSNRRLYVHKFSHATEEKFQCEICSARFRVKQYLKYHMIKHSTVKPYECKVCKKKFKHKKSWDKHLHHDKHMKIKEESHPCTSCIEVFSSRTSLLEHERLKHQSTTPFPNQAVIVKSETNLVSE